MSGGWSYEVLRTQVPRLDAHVQTLDPRVHLTYHLGEGCWYLYAPRPEGGGWLERVSVPIAPQDMTQPLDVFTARHLLPGLAALQRRLAAPREDEDG
jgi:hypothetical protein